MEKKIAHTKELLKLNGERTTRFYTAEIINEVLQDKNHSKTSIAFGFNLTYLGMTNEKSLLFKFNVDYRYFLNDKFSAIKKLNKAQKIAATVAVINNTLDFKLTKTFKLLEVTNTDDIRIKWMAVKRELLQKHPDLETMTKDFDWQLQEENIQQIYLEDNFYNFLFSNIFYHEFEKGNPLIQKKTIANGIGNINIPIIEEKNITKQNRAFTNVTISTTAKIDVDNNTFPLAKLNAFIGDLPTTKGKQYNLDFNYKGHYIIAPELGLVTQATLNYEFDIKDLYKKTTTITFNLENNE